MSSYTHIEVDEGMHCIIVHLLTLVTYLKLFLFFKLLIRSSQS